MSLDDNLTVRSSSVPEAVPNASAPAPPTRSLAEEAVPLLDAAQRELDRDRIERLRVIAPRHLRLPRPSLARLPIPLRPLPFSRGVASALAIALLGGAVAIAAASGGSGARGTANPPGAASAPTAPLASGRSQTPQLPSVAQARRRAALRAKHEAARRRARSHHLDRARGPRRKHPAEERQRGGADGGESALAEQAPAPQAAPTPEAAPVEAAPEETAPPAPEPSEPAGKEFGFEQRP